MRFVGAVLVVVAFGLMYFMAYKGMTIDQARTRLATLLNLPGLKPPAASVNGSAPSVPLITPGGGTTSSGRPFNPRGNLGSL